MTRGAREELRSELLRAVPRWYSPWLHLAIPAVTGLAILAFALSRVEGLRPWQLLSVPIFLAFGNAVEWHAHRGLLHRRTRPLEVLYLRHTPQHHAIFVAGDMFIRDFRELKFVLLPVYGVAALVLVTSPVTVALWALGEPNLAALWVASVVAYVLLYEWFHLAYHLPADGLVGGLRLTRWLRRHHERHHAPHLMQRWNFNVTVPLWDYVRGTVHREHRAAPSAAVARRA
jgi:sterol desaturase/sphingolipid hydroxylase (fatty acid hydroxylase superfamily)